jgi:hypothetical protein
MSAGRIVALLVLSGTLAGPWSGASATTPRHHVRSYPLPSDGWRFGDPAMEAISSAPFEPVLTGSGACTPRGSVDYLWPLGYRVRFHPTVLLDPAGRVVAHQGQYVTVGGGVIGPASWPGASRCDRGGEVWAVQGSVQVGRPGQFAARSFASP